MVSKHVTETHFEETDFDLPRTILHHPDPFVSVSQRSQRPSYAGRPSSSMLEQHPMYNQNRPQSALDTPIYYPSRRLPTPNDMTTSVKSVFDCELGCFEEAHENHHESKNDLDSTKASPSKSGTCQAHSPLTPTSPVSNLSQTSEPKEVWLPFWKHFVPILYYLPDKACVGLLRIFCHSWRNVDTSWEIFSRVCSSSLSMLALRTFWKSSKTCVNLEKKDWYHSSHHLLFFLFKRIIRILPLVLRYLREKKYIESCISE